MTDFFSLLLFSLLLAAALSVDAFVAGFSYGVDRIRIPLASVAVVGGLCSLLLAAALMAGSWFQRILSPEFSRWFSFSILLLLALTKLFDDPIKAFLRRVARKNTQNDTKPSILRLYAVPEEADSDHSRTLSPWEAATLSVALSLDGLAAGIGAGLAQTPVLLAVATTFFFTCLAVVCGTALGKRLSSRVRFDLSWVGGVLLLLLAVAKLFA